MHSTMGLLHPGAMGSQLGAAVAARGIRVLWCGDGRSAASRQRAQAAGLDEVNSLAELLENSPVVVSVCPPDAALDLARKVAAVGFHGIFVDANAIAPATAGRVADTVEAAGARFVDGGIIGPPPIKPGVARLYLSGPAASTVAELFHGSLLQAIAFHPRPGAASALKMAYAAYSKGHTALMIAVRALAAAEGVEPALLEEWGLSQQGLAERSETAARNNAHKAWRFVGEMQEISASFEANDLPAGFHSAAADLYRSLAGFKDAPEAPGLEQILTALARR